MDQVSQENELQRAIDDITKNGGVEEQNADVAAGLEEQIQNQMGTPPVPPMPPVGEGPTEAMPPMDGGAPVAEGEGAPTEVAAGAPGETPVEAPVEGQAGMQAEAPVSGEVAPAEGAVTVDETTTVAGDGLTDVVETRENVELNDVGGNDITSVKEAMLRDLFPIMDRVEMEAEEKFGLYKRMIEDTNDKSLIAGAYEVVKGISDEGARAEALLFLIKRADA